MHRPGSIHPVGVLHVRISKMFERSKRMLIIGERINSSRKSIARAIEERDKEFIMKEARIQAEAGADLIDVNAGAFADHEAEHLKWMIEAVQEATESPL